MGTGGVNTKPKLKIYSTEEICAELIRRFEIERFKNTFGETYEEAKKQLIINGNGRREYGRGRNKKGNR